MSEKAGERLPIASSDALIEELVGPMRCLRADLVVVGDLDSFISPDDDAMLPHVLAIIALGTPAITLVAWRLAHANPKQVPAASVIRYRPLAMELKVLFKYDAHFLARSYDVVNILRSVSGRDKSKWSILSAEADVGGGSGSNAAVAKGGGKGGGGSKAAVVKCVGRAAAGGGKGGGRFVAVGKGAGKVVRCGEDVELVKSGALSVLRSWIAKHRLIYNVIGSRAWTVHEPIV